MVLRVRETLQTLERFFSFVNDGYFLQCSFIEIEKSKNFIVQHQIRHDDQQTFLEVEPMLLGGSEIE